MRYVGKVAIITGSSDGIGKATAIILAREGATVILNARGKKGLTQIHDQIAEKGPPPLTVLGDSAETDIIDRLVNSAMEKFGRIDILINNSGGSCHTLPYEDITMEKWQSTLHANLQSAFFLTQAVATIMKRQKSGRIVNVSSFAGRQRSRLSSPDYACAKAGIIGLTRQLAWELGSHGITVNSVAPGITLTDRVEKLWQKRGDQDQLQVLENIPLRRLAQPEEVASAVAFLASDDASYITGVCLDVNGGAFMG